MTELEGVVPALATALADRGYESLTQVQKAVLAPEVEGSDALVSAQTGSGKTVAFGMALAPDLLEGQDRMARVRAPLALVVAPTRELALQVARELEWLYAKTGANIATCVGGMDMRTERRALQRGAHIVVGTPGRLRDHIERSSLDIGTLRAVVLDEADEMLDLGFREDLEYILDAAPKERRTLMFSATVPRSIASLAKDFQRDAIRISTKAEKEQHLDIEYRALTIAPNDRENAIVNLLRFYESENVLIFCATRATVNHMTSRFTNRGLAVVALSGELSQKERTHALQAMRDGRAQICVATDVAARGIDLPNLDLVIHAELPRNSESLLHRSGRTGRAGRKGVSALIVPFNARRKAERLLQGAKIKAEWASPPSAEEVLAKDRERIMEDPALTAPVVEDEREQVEALLERHGPEQIAAAFLRQHATKRSAPEELIGGSPEKEKKKQRENFKESIWFSLSAGRDQRVEPRWLVPMMCRVGHVTGKEIGRIRIQPFETHIEVSSEGATAFIQLAKDGGELEEDMILRQLKGEPSGADKPPSKSRGKNSRGKPHGLKKEHNAEKVRKVRGGKKVRTERAAEGSYDPRDKSDVEPMLTTHARQARAPSEKPADKGNDNPKSKSEKPGKPENFKPRKKKRPDKNKGARRGNKKSRSERGSATLKRRD